MNNPNAAILAELGRSGRQHSARELSVITRLPLATVVAALAELASLGCARRELLATPEGPLRAVWRAAGAP